MGASQEIIVYTHKMRTFLAITLAIACFMASANQDVDEDFGPIMELVDMSPEGDLMTTLGDMQKVAPTHMHFHINRIAKHAVLLQMDKKAAAYTHNFDASKAAIKAALKALTNQLNDGHRHDKAALATGINEGTSAISSKKTSGKNKCQTFKDKACPTKREEMEADAAKADAKKKMQNVGKGKVCDSLGSTWGDMDVDKATPKYGDELRNKWDKKRGEYETAKAKYDAAVKKHDAAMAEFKTALELEARNAVNACNQAHKEYNALKKEVASNVAARKQVFIATLVVTCYVDNLTDNGAAKTCADKKRGADTNQWNINPANLTPCNSNAELTNEFGPANWLPTSGRCSKAWHEASGKLIFEL